MLILLALPVVVVAAVHRYLQAYAPTNVLARQVRAQRPQWRTAAALSLLASIGFVAVAALGEAVAKGAPGWLNLVVLLLAWDAIKIGLLAVVVSVRTIFVALSRSIATG
jgi:hypothetical protein